MLGSKRLKNMIKAGEKLNVVVLRGGPSAEHDVSLATGQMVFEALDKEKYNATAITISKDGKWLLPKSGFKFINGNGNEKQLVPMEGGKVIGQFKSARKPIDVVFLALHGTYGEDGSIQGLFELTGLPYTGSGVLASALGLDKEMTKKILKAEKIPTPKYFIFSKGNHISLKKVKFPCVVKPVAQGSSVGVSIVQKPSQLKKAINAARQFDGRVMIEEFIEGREITAGVLGNKKLRALPLIEIKPKISDFFDYKAKYEAGGSEEICPAPIVSALAKRIQDLAVRIHKALGCGGVTRTDFILHGSQPYVLEINTLPGLTRTSLIPQAAAKAGINFSELLDRLIELALEK